LGNDSQTDSQTAFSIAYNEKDNTFSLTETDNDLQILNIDKNNILIEKDTQLNKSLFLSTQIELR
jgi:hypothetical protein